MLYPDFQKAHSTKCPFCSSSQVRGLISYETAFLTYSLAPYHKHHLLVIPKRHVESFLLLNAEEHEEIQGLLRFGMKLMHELGYKDCAMLVRDGDSGRSVRHLHYHIIPNVHIGDQDHVGQPRKILKKQAVNDLVSDIKRAEKSLRLKMKKQGRHSSRGAYIQG